jgi:hypothetical protein
MSIRVLTTAATTMLLALGWSTASFAACENMEFIAEITDQFPEANNACLELVERNGAQYARFDAEIVRVRGAEVRARFKKPNGEWTGTYAFRPPPERRIKIQGRSYRYQDLGRGQSLNVYIATDKFEAVIPDDDTDFVTTAAITTVAVYSPEPEPEMPKTASPVPLMGLLGGVFLVFAGGLAAIRRRLVRR